MGHINGKIKYMKKDIEGMEDIHTLVDSFFDRDSYTSDLAA